MSTLKPIYWHQGLFLKPQHFQYMQAYQQQESLILKENLEPYFWGLSKVSIDKKELLNEVFVLRDLEVVFMDGTVVKLPENAVVNGYHFNEIDEEIVYVGIKSFSESDLNVTELDSYSSIENIDTRFISKKDATKVNNLYHKDEPAEVQFMDYYLRIFFESEIKNLNGYQVMPIAKIKMEGEQVVLSDDFTPPILNIMANSNFYEIIKLIQKDLISHTLQLEEYKSVSDSLDKEPHYLKYILALQTLSGYVPKLNHMLKTPNIHPWHYYNLLVQIIGSLSTFSSRVNIFGKLNNGKQLFQEYNHQNLNEVFSEIKMLITELLEGIIIGPDYILPFTKNEMMFTLDCPVMIFNAKYRYFIVVKTTKDALEVKNNFINFSKIASDKDIDMIVQRSLLGLPFETYDMPIQGFPQRENSFYFELQTDDSHWVSIQQTQNISIDFEESNDDISIELVVLKK